MRRLILSVLISLWVVVFLGACSAAAPQTQPPTPTAVPTVQPLTPTAVPTVHPPTPTAMPTAQSITPTAVPTGPTAVVTPAVIPVGWQVYTNPAGFAISYPDTWTAQAQPDSNNGSIHTEALTGPEGEVDLSWGVGFGGACPSGYTTVKVAQGDIQTCYLKNDNGIESWTQMSHLLPNSGFSGRAATNNSQVASHDLVLQVLSTLTFAPTPAATPLAGATYTDPFAYCAGVGTIDTPDARYTGPARPEAVINGLQKALNLPGTPAPPVAQNSFWRCMNGKVYACAIGANLPCMEKADTSRTPSEEMAGFCQAQPNAEAIPAAVAGRSTVYEWRCKDGKGEVVKQVFQVDAQGYIADIWYQIPNPAAEPAVTPTVAALQPLSAAECAAMADGMAKTLGVQVTTGEAPISDWTTEQSGTGCQATATGTGEQFKSPDAVVKSLGNMMTSTGWTEDIKLQSGGPTGMGDGYRSNGEMCLTSAGWWPSADANCPKDQPITACEVTPAQQQYTVTLNCAQPVVAPAVAGTPVASMANPASQNCIKQGGKLEIRQRSDGAQYGVCLFEDNRQCEEWALLRGDCPVGGFKITGYVTLAAQYCAITGGQYTITGSGNTEKEQGTCTFKTGQTCDVWEYYAGTCSPTAAGQSTYNDPFAYCAAVGTIDAPDAPYAGAAMPDSIIQGMVKQGIVTADAPADFQKHAVWRCMEGRVWVCHFGANLPCQEKADLSQAPTADMKDFCTANPESESIPAVVTGRATVYEWRCADGQPQIVKQVFQVDPQGYLADFWHELPAQ